MFFFAVCILVTGIDHQESDYVGYDVNGTYVPTCNSTQRMTKKNPIKNRSRKTCTRVICGFLFGVRGKNRWDFYLIIYI